MAGRPPKEGIDYSTWVIDLFDNDPKIDKLLEAQGAAGFLVYFYLCQRAYGSKGYYYSWSYDDAATTARKIGGGVGSEAVRQTVGLCLQIGLFDKRLFDRDGILTSRGIQKRYWLVAKERTCNIIDPDYWLLEKAGDPNNQASESNYQGAKLNNAAPKSNYQTQKDSKGKQSKAEDTPPRAPEKKKTRKTDLSADEMARFEQFWDVWPKRTSRGQAEKTWKKLAPDDQLTADIIAGVHRAMQHDHRFRAIDQYTPHPSSWLNASGWKDEFKNNTGRGGYDEPWN